MRFRVLPTCSGILLTLGCGPKLYPIDPPAESLTFVAAGAWPECGPAAQLEVRLFLAPDSFATPTPPPPFVEVAIAQPPTRLTNRPWVVSGPATDGFALLCTDQDTCEAATDGTVSVTGVDADTTIVGTVDLTFPAGRVVTPFTAPWLPNRFSVAARRCVNP